MKSSVTTFQLALIACLAICNDSFNLFGITSKSFQSSKNKNPNFFAKKQNDPHPPDRPPPLEVLGGGKFFVNTPETEAILEAEKNVNGDAQPPAPKYEPQPVVSKEAKEMTSKAAQQFLDAVIKPMFEKQVQPGVASETIKGAALAGAALAFLASKGIIITSAAGLSAAYVAISQGVAGDVLRTVGGIAWDVTETATTLYQKATANEKMNGQVTAGTKELAEKIIKAVVASGSNAETLEVVKSKHDADSSEVEEAEMELLDSTEHLAHVLREAEDAIDAADDAIARADETLGTDDEDFEELEAARLEVLAAEEEAIRAEEEARMLAEEEARMAEAERTSEEARLAEEAAKEEERLAEVARLAEEEKAEAGLLIEELREAQAEVAREEERIAAAAKAKEEEAADEYDEEWEAAIELAQEGLEGTIVGVEEAIADDTAKANWDAAGALAQELQQGVGDEYDDDEDEIYTEALGKAAKEAVEMFEEDMKLTEAAKQQQRDEWASAMVSETDTEDSDLDAAEDMLPTGDLEEIARAARAAVQMMGDDEDDYTDEEDVEEVKGKVLELGDDAEEYDDEENFEGFEDEVASPTQNKATQMLRDWSSLTVAQLKVELKGRSLKTYGKKTELIGMLIEYDAEQLGAVYDEDEEEKEVESEYDSDSDSDGLDLDFAELEELGRQARAAVEMYENGDDDMLDVDGIAGLVGDEITLDELGKQARAAVFADEPSDEVLMQLESEEANADYGSMNVAQLKDELKSRGLRVSGKKAELIERLQSA